MAPRRERHQVGVIEDLALVRTLNQYIVERGFGVMEMFNKVFHSELVGWRSAISVAYGTAKITLTGTVLHLALAQRTHSSFMLWDQKCQPESHTGWAAKGPWSADPAARGSCLWKLLPPKLTFKCDISDQSQALTVHIPRDVSVALFLWSHQTSFLMQRVQAALPWALLLCTCREPRLAPHQLQCAPRTPPNLAGTLRL